MTTNHSCVAHVPIFSHLSDADQGKILQLVRPASFEVNEPLYLEASPADALYIIHQGQVQVKKTNDNGREQLLRTLGPGDFDGDQALFVPQVHNAEAVATAPVRACVIYRDDFQSLLKEYSDISLRVMAELAKRVAQLETQTARVTTASVAQRLALYLLDQPQDQFELPLKKKDLAAYLGTTPETISRQLRRFESAGWLTQPKSGWIHLLDRDALAVVE